MKKTILITGGMGYIGSHSVVAFEKAWYKTIIIDNLCNSSIDTSSYGIFISSHSFIKLMLRSILAASILDI